MRTRRYQNDDQGNWNEFVASARNATFLFNRHFMEYHKERFEDASLVFLNEKGHLQGLFPANFRDSRQRIESHGGLTYGGLVTARGTSLEEERDMLKALALTYQEMGATTLLYKPTPYIYHQYPAQEDLYWLFRANATLVARSVSSTIDLQCPLPFSTLRKRKVKKGERAALQVAQGRQEDWKPYWDILSQVLQEQHHTHPVHSLEEMTLLASRFPEQIQLYVVRNTTNVIAGCVVFDCGTTVHIQYIASSDEGRACGALDLLFQHLITQYAAAGKHYFDFGISTENGGQYLNEGLLFQKEGFGGRAVCYDAYEVDLKQLQEI